MRDEQADPTASGSGDTPVQRLVAKALQTVVPTEARPPEEAVLAYLHGTATLKQRDQVQKALAASSTFRAEFLKLGKTLDQLKTPTARDRFTEAPALSPPPLPIANSSSPTGHEEAGRKDTQKPPMPSTDTNHPRNIRILWARMIWVGLAAVCIIAALLIARRQEGASPDPVDVSWRQIETALPRELFSPDVSTDTLADLPGDLGADLAVKRFREVLRLRGEHLMVLEAAQPPPSPGPDPNRAAPAAGGLTRAFEVLDAGHRWRATVSAPLPDQADTVQAWLLSLPGLDLFACPVTAEVKTLGLPAGDPISRGLVLFTYEGALGEDATAPELVVFEKRDD